MFLILQFNFYFYLCIQRYPNEGLTTVVRNVFDFDSYNKELQETIVETMQKHGIPVGAAQASISLAKE